MNESQTRIAGDGPVMVTGASGYVAGWVVKALLERGVSVHAAVRDPNNADKTAHLRALAETAPGELNLFAADLLKPGSFAPAMAGCRVVFHTASPFVRRFSDAQTDLIEPAVEGTRNVLETVRTTETVHRVVLTSSCAAMFTDAIDTQRAPGGRLSEAVWNTTASLEYEPYSYSKTLAERKAWAMVSGQSRWDLVAVNPSLVIGPSLGANPTSESFRIVRQMADGTARFGMPRIGMGAVDVRDLAQAHLAAAFTPTASGRYIVSGHDSDLLAMAQCLQDKFADTFPLPKKALPKWLTWLVGPWVAGLSRGYVARNVDIPWHADNSKGVRELGLNYRPLQQSMEEMFAQMVARGDLSR